MENNQNAQIHALLNKTGLQKQKYTIAQSFTGREITSWMSDISKAEAEQIIRHLQKLQPPTHLPSPQQEAGQRMRRKLISLARQCGWEVFKFPVMKADMERIDNWCLTYSPAKKYLNDMNIAELAQAITIFETKIYIPYIKQVNQ